MPKTKHQKLAELMQEMLNHIEEHSLKVKQQLNLVQLHFYEPYLLLGRPSGRFHSQNLIDDNLEDIL